MGRESCAFYPNFDFAPTLLSERLEVGQRTRLGDTYKGQWQNKLNRLYFNLLPITFLIDKVKKAGKVLFVGL